MVQVIVKRQNQKATVDCSKVKGYVLGNGPSRSNLNLDDLKNDGIVYGCNALYRDWEPDFLFANDFRQIRQIFLDEFKGQCVFSDMDILPVMYFDDIFEGIRSSLPPHVAIKMNYYGDRDNATDFCYMGYENKHDIILQSLLNEFDISHVRKSKSIVLSGGERRRLEIARTLAARPRYLLLDEPLTGIDPVSIEEIKIIITKLKKKNIGVLITDHNVRETLKIVDRVYIVNEGMIYFNGNPSEAISDERIKKFYLGSNFSI